MNRANHLAPTSDEPDDQAALSSHAGVDVQVDFETDEPGPPIRNWLIEKLRMLLERLGICSGWLALTVVDDATMVELAERYRGEAQSTDVLSFDLRDDPIAEPGHMEADLVLCLEVARAQANRLGHDVQIELLLYALHGLLHLLGEDDHDAAGYDQMHQREDQLLEAIGVGPVFSGRNPVT